MARFAKLAAVVASLFVLCAFPRCARAGPERDPDDVFVNLCKRLVALEEKCGLLKGVSEVKPAVEREEKGRLKSASLVFEQNAIPPDKGPAKPKDASQPFVYVSIQVWSDHTQQAPADLYKIEWKCQTYQSWVRVFGSDAELVKSVHKSLDELLLQPPAPSAPPENPKKVQRKTVAELKEAVVGKWVSDDADRILVEFGADGSFSLALYGQDWKWRMAKGTYVVNDDGMVKYQAKLGGLGIRGHFAMKDGALIHPTGANYQTRWKKLPKNGDPPVAPQRDPEDAFAKACALVAALAATSGMSGPAI